MKTSLLSCALAFLILSCAEKKTLTNTTTNLPQPAMRTANDCGDTIGTIVFINSQQVEMKIGLSYKTSVKEGNTIINQWHHLRTISMQPGDSSIQVMKAEETFMYSLYGPVSKNASGYGVVKEEKFMLKPCEWRREKL